MWRLTPLEADSETGLSMRGALGRGRGGCGRGRGDVQWPPGPGDSLRPHSKRWWLSRPLSQAERKSHSAPINLWLGPPGWGDLGSRGGPLIGGPGPGLWRPPQHPQRSETRLPGKGLEDEQRFQAEAG